MPPKKRVRDQSGRKRTTDQADANREKQRARDDKRREVRLMEDKMKKKRDASGLDGDSVPSPLRAHELAKKKTRPRVEPARKAPSEPGACAPPRPLPSPPLLAPLLHRLTFLTPAADPSVCVIGPPWMLVQKRRTLVLI
jgi:hypothetical protein